MTHEYAGKYSSKHPAGTPHDPAVAAYIRATTRGGRLTCRDAHDGAAIFGVTPAEVGKTADLLEYRIAECQLGLFGYLPEKRIVRAADRVSDDLGGRLQAAAIDGSISCAECWSIADELGIPRLDAGSACETVGLKVKDCQLGAF